MTAAYCVACRQPANLDANGRCRNCAARAARERRRFIALALMCGWTTPERVVERIVDEIEREVQ